MIPSLEYKAVYLQCFESLQTAVSDYGSLCSTVMIASSSGASSSTKSSFGDSISVPLNQNENSNQIMSQIVMSLIMT
jgi:hypothetical protein